MALNNPFSAESQQSGREAPNAITLKAVTGLYDKYGQDLLATRRYLADVLETQRAGGNEQMRMQFDDLDAELLYLLVRETLPRNVVEISPRDGWSSLWLLKALQDNDRGCLFEPGHLHSFDLEDTSTQFIPEELKPLRTIAVGDVREQMEDIPEDIDFLLIDSAHNARFAKWYIDNVLPRVKSGAPIVIHDIRQPGVRRIPGTESYYVHRFLKEGGISFFSMSSIPSELVDGVNRDIVMSIRRINGLDRPILHEGRGNLFLTINRLILGSAVLISGHLIGPYDSKGNPAVFFTAP